MLIIFYRILQDVNVEDSSRPDASVGYKLSGTLADMAAQSSERISANYSLFGNITLSPAEKRQALIGMIAFFCINRSTLGERSLEALFETSTRYL